MRRSAAAAVLCLATLGACPRPARAQSAWSSPLSGPTAIPPAAREVDIEEHLGRRIDTSLAFTDMDGRRVRLGDYVDGGAPVVLVLAYYRCPMLCGLVLRGVVDGLKQIDGSVAARVHAITVSIDPRDTPERAHQKRESTLDGLGRPAPGGWPFLVGEEPAIHALADAIGFRYAYDPGSAQYAHPAAAIVLTPDGRVSRYLYGTAPSARDLRLALVEAGGGRIGTIVDRLVLTCYRYDPSARAYGPFILGFMRIGGVLILAAVVALVAALFVGEQRRKRALALRDGGSP